MVAIVCTESHQNSTMPTLHEARAAKADAKQQHERAALLFARCSTPVDCMAAQSYHIKVRCAFAATLSGGLCLSKVAAS